jgi:hypothetical protein
VWDGCCFFSCCVCFFCCRSRWHTVPHCGEWVKQKTMRSLHWTDFCSKL